jgi:hypothetical protein
VVQRLTALGLEDVTGAVKPKDSEDPSLEQVLKITEGMLEAATAKQWQHLMTLQRTRDALLQPIFGPSSSTTKRMASLDTINTLLELNRRITLLIEEERRICGARLRELKTGQRATDLYRRQR